MASKKSDVRFKYVNTIPSSVEQGAFYWKNENGKNQLYFSPSDKPNDVMRLDNVISGQGGSALAVGSNITLVSIFPEIDPRVFDEHTQSYTTWTDEQWQDYICYLINGKGEDDRYGNISNSLYLQGNVIICGSREFICTFSQPNYETITIDNVDYFKSHLTGTACVDDDNNKIEYDSSIKNPPFDAAVSEYFNLEWECFGENLSKDLADKIANFSMEINPKTPIKVEKSYISGAYSYTLSIDFRETNPLVVKNENGINKIDLSDSDFEPSNTIMSVSQIKNILDQIANLNWNENL